MAIVTFDNTDIKTQYPFSYVLRTDTGSGNITKTHGFTVHGNGFVVVTISVATDSTSDYGSTLLYIWLNGYIKAFNYNRLTSSASQPQGGTLSVGLQVSDGDTISTQIDQTKNGSKTFRYYCFCVNCTVTYT